MTTSNSTSVKARRLVTVNLLNMTGTPINFRIDMDCSHSTYNSRVKSKRER